jgi:uncharacterized protein (DUF1499 family)
MNKKVRNSSSLLALAAPAGLILAIAAAVVAVGAGFGTRVNWWDFGAGFSLLRWGFYIAIAAAVLSLLGLVVSRPLSGWRALLAAILGLVIAAPVIIVPLTWINTARSVPPIHDITTDTQNPPQFHAILALRKDAANSAQYGGPEVASLQHEAYPDIGPVFDSVSPALAFTTALQSARDLGWNIVAKDPSDGRIEATDTTFWFGFTDDIVIRVMREGDGVRTDIRSVSRVGRSDIGTNAARVRAFLAEFKRLIQKDL